MELPIDATASVKFAQLFGSLNAKGIKPIEIHRQLMEVYGESCMDVKNFREWCKEFAAGRTEIHDEKRCGRPSISDERQSRSLSKSCVKISGTLDDLLILVPEVSQSTIHRVLSEKWQYRKVCTKEHLVGTRFSNDDDEVKDEVQRFLDDLAVSWYDKGTQRLPQRQQKCIDRNGDYVEKIDKCLNFKII
uniref:Uncharacterized protein n=1 Tax=Octopus bimaculoides TaxID=37653 RepID=A0A0L8H3J0_OCTBM